MKTFLLPALRSFAFAAAAALAVAAPRAHGASLTWDSSGANPAAPVDGAGTWDTSSGNWSNGVTNSAWNNANNDTAIFGNNNGAAGTVNLGTGITANGLTFNAPGSGSYIIAGDAITLAGATPTITANVNATISSNLTGSAGLKKAGSGTLFLSGNNTYTGNTIISGGAISIGGAYSALANGTVTFDGGYIETTGSLPNSNGRFTFRLMTTGGGFIARGSAAQIRNPFSYTGADSGNRILTLTGNGTALFDTGLGDGPGGVTSVVKDGTSTWTWNNGAGSNTYTGSTTVNNGTINITGANIDSSSSLVINTGATVGMDSGKTIKELLDGTGGGGNLRSNFSNSTITIQSGNFSGRIFSNNDTTRQLGVVKDTAGTLRLSNATNDYTLGTTISDGTLLVNNPSGVGLGRGAVSVTNATLGGIGFLRTAGANSTTVGTGGIIAPGDPLITLGIGTLTFNGGNTSGAVLDMQAGSKFQFDLSSGNASDTVAFWNYAGASDFLRDAGGVTLDFSGAQEGRFELFKFYSNNGTTLTSAGFTEGTSNFLLGSGLTGFNTSWDYGTTGVVALQVTLIPEPAGSMLLATGLGSLVLLRRRRSSGF